MMMTTMKLTGQSLTLILEGDGLAQDQKTIQALFDLIGEGRVFRIVDTSHPRQIALHSSRKSVAAGDVQ